MATIPDIVLTPGAYTEVYAATGIASGTQLVIQNKSRGDIGVQNGPSQPAGTDCNGFVIPILGIWRVPAGTAKAWFKGDGAMAVEVL